MFKTDNHAELIDICTVEVDKSLPKQERITEFIRQIKNPYRFKCENFIVNTRYCNNGISFEDCLQLMV